MPGVVALGEGDIQYLKEGQVRIEKVLGELTRAVNDFRVMAAESYVKKDEYADHLKTEEARVVAIHNKINEHEKSERSERWKIFGAAMTVAALVVGVIQWVVNLVKVKG